MTEDINQRLERLELQVRGLHQLISEGFASMNERIDQAGTRPPLDPVSDSGNLRKISTRMHVVLQMLARNASNDEIAARMYVSPNTVKAQTRSLQRYLGVTRRHEASSVAKQILMTTDPEVYAAGSGGLPIAWDDNYVSPDPYLWLYLPAKQSGAKDYRKVLDDLRKTKDAFAKAGLMSEREMDKLLKDVSARQKQFEKGKSV